MTLYTCTKCREVLPVEAFSINTKRGKQYRRTECKQCLRDRARRNDAPRRIRPLGWHAELRALSVSAPHLSAESP